MIRQLLADRFRLKVHQESTEGRIYNLIQELCAGI
jgi:uncharacterized protein (TIGR03435 family)